MSAIRSETRTVYFAPTKNQRYLTAKTAADNEAKAKILAKYPSERSDYDGNGYCTDPGWHWSLDERLIRVHKRYMRVLLRAFKQDQRRAAALLEKL